MTQSDTKPFNKIGRANRRPASPFNADTFGRLEPFDRPMSAVPGALALLRSPRSSKVNGGWIARGASESVVRTYMYMPPFTAST